MLKPSVVKQTRPRLAAVLHHSSRIRGNVVTLSPEEANLICLLTLQSWDWMVNLIATGTEEALSAIVADPAAFVANRLNTVCVFQDAVPVCLDASTGKGAGVLGSVLSPWAEESDDGEPKS